ncbi:MAG: 4'-phosphopantetheinyl transferase superfamily protein [Deltaproteobacteria bacterium]|nr:4'-phosphopantetheinyl transferase superfamily protein [Deltaproteobacteria bacterium]
MTALPLAPDEIHVWYLLPSEASHPSLLERYRALLTAEEQDRTQRYVFAKNQVEHLLTRALARTVLARYVGAEPRELRFSRTELGRPELVSPGAPGLAFNLANTEGLIICAVARDRSIGVDAEWLERSGQTVEIAEQYFSKREIAELRSLPVGHQRRRFFDYWTLKEAYIKARGIGLGLPLDRFSFLLGASRATSAPVRIEIAIEPELGDRSERWWFEQLDLSPSHKIAVAATRAPTETLRLVIRRTVPLEEPR